MASFNSIQLSTSNIDVNIYSLEKTTSNSSDTKLHIRDSFKTCNLSDSSMSFKDTNISNKATYTANSINSSPMPKYSNEYFY
jgi:hypothetical protein